MYAFQVARPEEHLFPIYIYSPRLKMHGVARPANKVHFENHAGSGQPHPHAFLREWIIM